MRKPWFFQFLLIGGVLLLSMGLARADSVEKGGSSYGPDPQHPRPEIVILRTVPPRTAFRPLNPNNRADVIGMDISPGVTQGTAQLAAAVLDDMQLAAGNAGGGGLGAGVAALVHNGLASVLGDSTSILAPGGGAGTGGGGGQTTGGIAGLINGAMSPLQHMPH
jgi:hypothetical protein